MKLAGEETKDYLGDSVYADFDGYGIVLTTENGYGPSNTIYLEPNVQSALRVYQDRIKSLCEQAGAPEGGEA